jgi:hypothetical protein
MNSHVDRVLMIGAVLCACQRGQSHLRALRERTKHNCFSRLRVDIELKLEAKSRDLWDYIMRQGAVVTTNMTAQRV